MKRIIVLLCFIILSGCGESSESNQIVGTWESPDCGSLSFSKTRTRYNSNGTGFSDIYKYSDCETIEEVRRIWEGEYKIDGKVKTYTGEYATIISIIEPETEPMYIFPHKKSDSNQSDNYSFKLIYFIDNGMMYYVESANGLYVIRFDIALQRVD